LSTADRHPLSALRCGRHHGGMTRTSLPSDPLVGPPGNGPSTSLWSERDPRGEAGPMRRRSRFPAADAQAADGTVDGAPRALWSGAETALREQVADHATAAGLELVDETGSAPVAVHLIDAAALTGAGSGA